MQNVRRRKIPEKYVGVWKFICLKVIARNIVYFFIIFFEKFWYQHSSSKVILDQKGSENA